MLCVAKISCIFIQTLTHPTDHMVFIVQLSHLSTYPPLEFDSYWARSEGRFPNRTDAPSLMLQYQYLPTYFITSSQLQAMAAKLTQ